jgi:osmoprotectant transport system permease protein
MRTRILALLLLLPGLCHAQGTVNVGSKRFTESYILGEIITQTVGNAGEGTAVHHPGMGNTGIVFAALKSGAIDVYPEYTGTIAFELLRRPTVANIDELNRELVRHGLAIGIPLGFSNTYGLAMREERAAALGITSITDLRRHADLRLGLSQEFLNRKDGWAALQQAYALPFAAPRGLDHGLAYEALAAQQIDVIDVYSTDAKLDKYHLRVLVDDRKFFPAYDAVLLYRRDLPDRFPASWAALQKLTGGISPRQMIALNAQVEVAGVPFAEAARSFLAGTSGSGSAGGARPRSFVRMLFGPDFWRLTGEHLLLVFASLVLSTALAVPLGVWAERSHRASHWILAMVGVLQTIPSLALLAFLITLMGTIGTAPALGALFLYGLLPIVRNTLSGLADIGTSLRESAQALGLSDWVQLRDVELPLAARSILAGIKTAAVINVGTATVAAFIGAGGYGERIVAGLAVHDNAMLLAGAIPAAMLALLIQWGFDGLDRWAIPRGLEPGGRRAY